MGRLVIVGLDGVPFRLLEKYSENGIMPNFKKIKDRYFVKMKSTIPEISSCSWSSIITGENPGEHGIYGFTEMISNTYSLRYPNFKNLSSPTFWEKYPEKKMVTINIPMTFPVEEVNGFIVSGFVSLDIEKAVWPTNYADFIFASKYKIDVDSVKAHKSKFLFLKELYDVLDAREKMLDKMWDTFEWEVFTYVITGTDRIGHFMFSAFDNPDHEFKNGFEKFFKKVDKQIGKILNKMNDDDDLIMLSDHGMETKDFNVYVNRVLENEGLLKFKKDGYRYCDMTEETKAFALDPGRIYLHKKGKYPNGSVSRRDKKLIRKIKDIFNKLKLRNKKPIRNVYERDEIYSGKRFYDAPEIILQPNKGFSLKSKFENAVFDKPHSPFEGDHTYDDAFLLVKTKKDIKLPKKPEVFDVFPIIDKFIGDQD